MASGTEIQPSWLTFLIKQASIPSGKEFVPKVLNIFIDFLLSENDDAAAKAAKKIDDSTRDSLFFVFQTIYDLAALIPYEDRKQDMLLQLIVELLKLPRKTFKGADGKVSKDLIVEESPTYHDLNIEVKHDMWNARNVDELDLDVKTQDEYTQSCIEWVNLSAFYARCIAANIDDHDKNACKFPDIEIREALEPDYDPTPGIDTDFRVAIATRYIIVAGEKIREENFKWWDEHVPIWERKLEEFERSYENGFPEFTPRFETPPGEKELIGTGDLGMDILASVKAARKKLKDMRGVLEQESNEDLTEKKDE
ncbi:uncharacterized protein Bfra_001293 [Botrytis fragariae]|uniref:Uncharacterized protein n=1 Tax=Botrytis fragariae TaxID=1964551 RepID=A0A8H6B0L2_9HELO|nr:uncharacterized protein Bfra_001293 [Botrytis fragariae]KAF5876935.1 hypothetical protein Bfra_001293 [Botrytis fragariae]